VALQALPNLGRLSSRRWQFAFWKYLTQIVTPLANIAITVEYQKLISEEGIIIIITIIDVSILTVLRT
jgi:hypothetical protein